MPMIAVARIARTKQLDDADSVRRHQRTDLRARDRAHTAARHEIDSLSRLVIAALRAISGVHGSHPVGDTAAKSVEQQASDPLRPTFIRRRPPIGDRQRVVSGKSVAVRVELRGTRTLKKKK